MTEKEKKDYEKYMKTGKYFVVSIRPKIKKIKGVPTLWYGGKYPTRSRCWGWYNKLKDAVTAIEENHCDIFEGDADYAVIEKVPEGIVPDTQEIQWFKWYPYVFNQQGKDFNRDPSFGKYIKCPKPEWSEGIIAWSL
jgi:hypothetical protein